MACNCKSIFTLFFALSILGTSCNNSHKEDTWNVNEFKSPSLNYGPHVWYHWQNGHISTESISKELEEMKDKGIGGVTLFNVAEGVPAGPVPYLSEEWWKAIAHLKKEVKRLGMELSIMNTAGWSTTAGPWVTPDLAMQEVAWTEKFVNGPQRVEVKLAEPTPVLGLTRDMKRDSVINRRYYVSRDVTKGYFKDIAVLAYPTLNGEEDGKEHHISDWVGKTGRIKMYQYKKDQTICSKGESVNLSDIIDISDKISKDGTLMWNVPEGNWTILRVGYQPTGRQNHPTPSEGRGLEINKMSKEALDLHWKKFIEPMLTCGGEKDTQSTIKKILLDSYEAGHQNWTAGFENKFKELCGYDIIKYLPCIAGKVVESTDKTEKFLWDFRQVINQLILNNYYKHYSELCHAKGLQLEAEHYGNFGNINDFDAGKYVDVPAAEFWAMNFTNHSGTAKLSSSTANIYGKKIVGAEAFSGMPKRIFETTPASIKAQGDLYMSQGINQFWLHGFSHDPYGKAPGMTLGGYGSNFNNRNTLWNYSKGWFNYISRCQYMLQNGHSANDILYFAGEDAPLRSEGKFMPIIPFGYDYDLCNKETLNDLKVVDGRLVTPIGVEYKMLVVRNLDYLPVSTLKRIKELLALGANVCMKVPVSSPSMVKEESDLAEYSSLLTELGSFNNLYSESNLNKVFKNHGLQPDFEYKLLSESDEDLSDKIKFIHKKDGYSDVYFVHSLVKSPVKLSAIFRVNKKYPQLWDAMTGNITKALEYKQLADGRVSVELNLEEEGSIFVVFKEDKSIKINISTEKELMNNYEIEFDENHSYFTTATPGKYKISDNVSEDKIILVPSLGESIDLSNSWNVHFPHKDLSLKQLIDWKDSEDETIKYYSGEADYTKTFDLMFDESNKNIHYVLDLGKVKEISQLFVNGQQVKTLWKEPYEADITRFLHKGNNEIKVKVVNLWVNRIIRDYQLPEHVVWTKNTGSTEKGMGLTEVPQWLRDGLNSPTNRETFLFWRWEHFENKSPLPSGLIGPICLKPIWKTLLN